MSRKMTISEIAKQAYGIEQQRLQQQRAATEAQKAKREYDLRDEAMDIALASPLVEWFGRSGWEFVWRNTNDFSGNVSVIVKRQDPDDQEWRFMVTRTTYADHFPAQYLLAIMEQADNLFDCFGTSKHRKVVEVRDTAGVGAYLHTREQERHMVAVPQDSD